ncbi:MAG: DUF5615 family PIN-like protein [bacterium]
MKLLYDNNLSTKLPKLLADVFPDSIHVVEIGMRNFEDIEIWKYAKEKNLTIVSKDKDFYYLNSAFGSPPKSIWLVLGNCRIEDTVKILREIKKKSFISLKVIMTIMTC